MPGLSQRLASGHIPLVECVPSAAQQPIRLGATTRAAERVDERYPNLGMRPIARSIRSWWRDLPADSRLGLVMSYPHYIYLRDLLQPDVSLYYNIDDYSLYWPREAAAGSATWKTRWSVRRM